MEEIIVSVDVETDGPIPGPHSMLALGAAAFDDQGRVFSRFEVNLELLPEAKPHEETMTWWRDHPEAWAHCRRDPRAPEEAMARLVQWLAELRGRPVFAGYPAAWDFMWVYWYLLRFVGQSPFSHSALDIKTCAAMALDLPYRRVGRKTLPKAWQGENPAPHTPLADAIQQGRMLMKIRAAARN